MATKPGPQSTALSLLIKAHLRPYQPLNLGDSSRYKWTLPCPGPLGPGRTGSGRQMTNQRPTGRFIGYYLH